MKITAEPRSDQINYEDFLAGPRVYTIGGVRVGTAEQKYDIQLQGEERVWRPPLTVLRILIACWGDDAEQWYGRQVELFGDPSIRFGKEAVGGIRIAKLSHLDEPKTVSVTVARGKRQKITVQPLPAQETQPQQQAPDIDAYIEQADGDPEKVQQLHDWAKGNGAPQQVLDQIMASQQGAQEEGEQA